MAELLGGFSAKKTIRTTEEVLGHKSNTSEELVSPKHLRCGSTWYSYIQENMMPSFILDATVIRASRSLDMGSKGIWVVFVQIVCNSQTHQGFLQKILRHIMWAAISQIYKLQATRIDISKVWGHMIFSRGEGVHNQSVFGRVGTNIMFKKYNLNNPK